MTQIPSNIPWFSSQQFQRNFIEADTAPFGRDDSFKLVRIEEVIQYLKFPFPLHRTDYYDILFIAKGQPSIKHRGLKKYRIDAGHVFFKAAGQITSGDILGKDIEGYFCLFKEEFFATAGFAKSPLTGLPFFRYDQDPLIKLTDAQIEVFKTLFNRMYEQNGNTPVVAAYLHALLQEAQSIHQTQHTAPDTGLTSAEVLTDRFKDLVSEHYLDKRQVKDYADLLCVTPNHLNKVVRKASGRTALDLIADMLIMEAEILLRQTTMTIAEIAAYLSFEDASYFTRFFRKQKGVTPGAYRKQE